MLDCKCLCRHLDHRGTAGENVPVDMKSVQDPIKFIYHSTALVNQNNALPFLPCREEAT